MRIILKRVQLEFLQIYSRHKTYASSVLRSFIDETFRTSFILKDEGNNLQYNFMEWGQENEVRQVAIYEYVYT